MKQALRNAVSSCPLQSYICTTISETPPLSALTPRLLSLVLIDGCHARFPGRLLVIAPSLGSLPVAITANKQRSEALGLHGCVYNTLLVEHRRRAGLRRISPLLAMLARISDFDVISTLAFGSTFVLGVVTDAGL